MKYLSRLAHIQRVLKKDVVIYNVAIRDGNRWLPINDFCDYYGMELVCITDHQTIGQIATFKYAVSYDDSYKSEERSEMPEIRS